MPGLDRCPFCVPRTDEVLVERPLARALLDIRPLCHGHVLVVPTVHVASVADADLPARRAVLELARELANAFRRSFGEAGIYEHGGSPICRPRACAGGPTHAHLHVLPLAEDLNSLWMAEARPIASAGVNRHYLYQDVDGCQSRARSALPPVVPRHFIRRLLQYALVERGSPWLPMGAEPHLHAATAAETREIVGRSLEHLPSRTWPAPSGHVDLVGAERRSG